MYTLANGYFPAEGDAVDCWQDLCVGSADTKMSSLVIEAFTINISLLTQLLLLRRGTNIVTGLSTPPAIALIHVSYTGLQNNS